MSRLYVQIWNSSDWTGPSSVGPVHQIDGPVRDIWKFWDWSEIFIFKADSTGLSARYYMNLNVKFVFQNICYKRSKWPCLSHFSNFGAEPLDVLLWSDQAYTLRTLVIDARCLYQSLWSALIQTVRSRHLKVVLVGNWWWNCLPSMLKLCMVTQLTLVIQQQS